MHSFVTKLFLQSPEWIASTVAASLLAASLGFTVSRTVLTLFEDSPTVPPTLVSTVASIPCWGRHRDLTPSQGVATVTRLFGGHCQATVISCFVNIQIPGASTNL